MQPGLQSSEVSLEESSGGCGRDPWTPRLGVFDIRGKTNIIEEVFENRDKHICIYTDYSIYVYVQVYASVYVYIYEYVYVYIYIYILCICICISICVCICICICICVCTCVYVCVYIYIYIIVPIADPELRQNQGCEPATVESATCADFGGNRPGSPGNRIFLGSGPGSWSKIPCQSRSV